MKLCITRTLKCILPLLALMCNTAYPMGSMVAQLNPLRQTDYKRAFSQAGLYRQFDSLMTQQECAHNVITDDEDAAPSCTCCSTLFSVFSTCGHIFETKKPLTQADKFDQACLDRLEAARRTAILKGADEGVMSVITSITLTYALLRLSPSKTAASIAVYDICKKALKQVKGIVFSIAALKQPHTHLDDLEREYAINKRFIPHELWEKIEKNFEYARKGDDNQHLYISFIEFALNFKTLKPQKSATFNSNAVIGELFSRMDHFLNAYDITPAQLALLKTNIRNFVENMAGTKKHPLRYLFLVGPGGIGKSKFVEQLHSWFEELMPLMINFNKYSVKNAEELEGNDKNKGILLETLGEQLHHQKHGSIVLLDDANWFTEKGSMASAAKRVFNADLSEMNTAYFSQSGTAEFSLPMTPMLIFFTSNDPISDKHLGSRFDIIHFPCNTTEALKQHALALCEADEEYQRADPRTQAAIQELLLSEIDEEDTHTKTFRDVNLRVEPLCFEMTHQCDTHSREPIHHSYAPRTRTVAPHLKTD